MKKLIILAFAILSTSVFADADREFTVLKRKDRSSGTYYTKVTLENLESDHSFDGKYFKIVNGIQNEAISFDEKDETLALKAANAYYHLTQARNFWVDKIQSEFAAQIPKLTVRLDITNQFDELGHFANVKRNPQYNNALSIPAGATPEWVPEDRKDKWGNEIWFRPKKLILTKDLPKTGPNPLTVALESLQNPLISYSQNEFNVRLMERFFYPTYVTRPFHEDVIRLVGTFAIMKVIIFGSKHSDRLFMDKYYYLDTAMIPEIAFHEYSHIALSDHLQMSHSTSVNEGMADYFAAVLSDKRKVYAKVSGFSNAAPKDRQQKRPYSHWDESNRNATADFTLSVLWDVRETLGEEIGDKVVYQARKYLKTETSTISDGLLRAILRACEDKCEEPRRDKYKLFDTFGKKGF